MKEIYHYLERKQAASKMSKSRAKVIGLTGSQGKTSTAQAIAAVLATKYSVLTTDVNLDPIYAIPQLVGRLKKEDFAVVEMAVDKPGQMSEYLRMVKPELGVLTGIAPVHADAEHLGSIEGIIKEKSALLEALPTSGVAICNWDDPRVVDMARRTKARVIKYGTKDGCNVCIEESSVSLKGTQVVLSTERGDLRLNLKLIGKQHAYTAAAAVGVALEVGVELADIKKGLEQLEPLPGRMSLEEGPMGTTILNDARRANLASTLSGLATLAEIPAGRKIAVLGQMAEMGRYEEAGHREVGRKVAEIKPNYLVTIGPATKFIVQEVEKSLPRETVFYTEDVFAAAKKLKEILRPGDLWYLKGSLLKHLERIPLILEGKEVDSDEIASHRYEVYR